MRPGGRGWLLGTMHSEESGRRKYFKSLTLKGLNGRWDFQGGNTQQLNERWDEPQKRIKALRARGSQLKGFSETGIKKHS